VYSHVAPFDGALGRRGPAWSHPFTSTRSGGAWDGLVKGAMGPVVPVGVA